MTKLEQVRERAIERFEKDHRLEDGRLADIGFNGGTTEDFIKSLITEVWNEAIKECEGCVPEKATGQYYNGNKLESACDYYGIAAEGWEEIIRYEDGQNSCRNQTLQAISKLRV